MAQCSSCNGDIRITINNGYSTNGYSTTSNLCSTCSTSSSTCSTCTDCNCSCNNCNEECPGGTTYTSCLVFNGDALDCLAEPITTATALNDVVEALAAAICVLEEGIVPDMCASLGTASIDCLEDVTITTPTDNQFLRYVTDEWVNSVIVLDDLDDVIITTPADNDTLEYNGTNWVNTPKPYLVYTAILTQSGAGVPTATILENTIGTITWSRLSAGHYRGTTAGLYVNNKTVGFTSIKDINSIVQASYTSVNNFDVNVQTATTGLDNDTWTMTIEIRVYN